MLQMLMLPELFHNTKSVESRQYHVKHEQIRNKLQTDLNGLLPGPGMEHHRAMLFKGRREHSH